jgi:signal transduction histidine kinase
VEEIRDQVADSVETTLVSARTVLDERIAGSDVSTVTSHWPQLSHALRQTASETVRPLSKALWVAASEPFQNSRPWSIIRFVLSHQPLRPFAVSVIFVVGSGSQIFEQEGTVDGFLRLIFSILLIVLIMQLANFLMRKHPRQHAKIFLGATALLQVPVIADFLFAPSRGDVTSSTLDVIGTVVAGVVVVFLTSAFGALLKLNMEQISQVSENIDQEFVQASARSRALAEALREAGSILHGTIQGRLLACAMSVEQAGQAEDIEQMNAALERAKQELDQPLPTLTRSRVATTLLEELERHGALWSGLCQVDIQIDPNVPDLRETTINQCGLVVEEAISNAIRHGDARVISVRVTKEFSDKLPDSPLLRIAVIDDGSGVRKSGVAMGVGFTLITDISHSWSIANVDGQCCLDVLIEY